MFFDLLRLCYNNTLALGSFSTIQPPQYINKEHHVARDEHVEQFSLQLLMDEIYRKVVKGYWQFLLLSYVTIGRSAHFSQVIEKFF